MSEGAAHEMKAKTMTSTMLLLKKSRRAVCSSLGECSGNLDSPCGNLSQWMTPPFRHEMDSQPDLNLPRRGNPHQDSTAGSAPCPLRPSPADRAPKSNRCRCWERAVPPFGQPACNGGKALGSRALKTQCVFLSKIRDAPSSSRSACGRRRTPPPLTPCLLLR